MIWAGSVVFAFALGYSKAIDSPDLRQDVWVVIGLVFGGAFLMWDNGAGEKMWTEDPEAARRWGEDLERERLRGKRPLDLAVSNSPAKTDV